MPSPHRCPFNRFHRHSSTIEECEQRQSNRGETKRTQTPYPEFEREASSLPKIKRRRRQRALTPEAGEESAVESPSPLQSRSTNIVGGLFTPIQSQEPVQESMASPASTQVVPETPLSQLRKGPALGDAGPSNYNHDSVASPFDNRDPGTPPFANYDPGLLPPSPPADPEPEAIRKLRASRNRLTLRLEESTASNDRLQAERQVLRDEVQRTQTLFVNAKNERDAAVVETKSVPKINRRLVAALIFVLLMIVAYVLWYWHKSPEMAYIRKRRCEVLVE